MEADDTEAWCQTLGFNSDDGGDLSDTFHPILTTELATSNDVAFDEVPTGSIRLPVEDWIVSLLAPTNYTGDQPSLMSSTESDDDDELPIIDTNNDFTAMENGGHEGNPYDWVPPGVLVPNVAAAAPNKQGTEIPLPAPNLEPGEDEERPNNSNEMHVPVLFEQLPEFGVELRGKDSKGANEPTKFVKELREGHFPNGGRKKAVKEKVTNEWIEKEIIGKLKQRYNCANIPFVVKENGKYRLLSETETYAEIRTAIGNYKGKKKKLFGEEKHDKIHKDIKSYESNVPKNQEELPGKKKASNSKKVVPTLNVNVVRHTTSSRACLSALIKDKRSLLRTMQDCVRKAVYEGIIDCIFGAAIDGNLVEENLVEELFNWMQETWDRFFESDNDCSNGFGSNDMNGQESHIEKKLPAVPIDSIEQSSTPSLLARMFTHWLESKRQLLSIMQNDPVKTLVYEGIIDSIDRFKDDKSIVEVMYTWMEDTWNRFFEKDKAQKRYILATLDDKDADDSDSSGNGNSNSSDKSKKPRGNPKNDKNYESEPPSNGDSHDVDPWGHVPTSTSYGVSIDKYNDFESGDGSTCSDTSSITSDRDDDDDDNDDLNGDGRIMTRHGSQQSATVESITLILLFITELIIHIHYFAVAQMPQLWRRYFHKIALKDHEPRRSITIYLLIIYACTLIFMLTVYQTRQFIDQISDVDIKNFHTEILRHHGNINHKAQQYRIMNALTSWVWGCIGILTAGQMLLCGAFCEMLIFGLQNVALHAHTIQQGIQQIYTEIQQMSMNIVDRFGSNVSRRIDKMNDNEIGTAEVLTRVPYARNIGGMSRNNELAEWTPPQVPTSLPVPPSRTDGEDDEEEDDDDKDEKRSEETLSKSSREL